MASIAVPDHPASPLPPVSEPHAGLSPEQQRRNVLLLGADMVLFMAALGLVAPTTLVPLFVSKLTENPLAIGALTAVFQIGWLSQLFSAGYIERSARKRRWLLGFSGLERLPTLALALSALTAPYLGASLVLVLVYLCRFGQSLVGGPAATAWLDYVARAVPVERRGRFMGISTMLGNLLGVGAAALAAPLLDRLPFPLGFAACFGIGFLILLSGYLPLVWVVEPPGAPPRASGPLHRQLAELPGILAADAPFGRFLAGLACGALGAMGVGFLVVYATTRLGASDELAAWYTAILLVGQMSANLGFGWLADRRGFGAVALASCLAGAAVAAVALAAPSPLWLIAAFALVGVGQAGVMLAWLAGPMELAPPARRPSYIALAGAVVGLASAAAPLVGGQIVATLGYEWMFGAGLVLSLAAVAILGRQPRPGKRGLPQEYR